MKIILEKAIRELEYTKYASDEIVTATKSGKKFENGLAAKESLIRSQNLIYHLHDFVKQEFQDYGVSSDRIFPPLNKNAPEKRLRVILNKRIRMYVLFQNLIRINLNRKKLIGDHLKIEVW